MWKIFKEDRGLTAHLDKSPSCAQALTKIMYCQPTMKTLEATDNTQIQSQINSFTEYQLNSIDNNMEDTNVNIENQSLERLDDQVNTVETMDNTPSNPVCYTNTMYYQTKLLKILDDANVSHDLYKKIIKWLNEAQI